MRVEVDVDEIEVETEHGNMIPGLCVTCGRCNHTVEVFGTSDWSVRRGLVMLREECPEGESNFYVDPDADE